MAERDKRIDNRLAAIFRQEAAEHVRTLLDQLVALEPADAASRPAIARVCFRAAHSLKGAARAVGKADVEAVCHVLETLFLALEKAALPATPQVLDLLHRAVHELGHASASPGPAAHPPLLALLEPLERAAEHDTPAAPPSPPSTAAPGRPATAEPGEGTIRISVERLQRLLYQVEELVSAKAAAFAHARLAQELGAAVTALVAPADGADSAAAEARRHALARLKALREGAERHARTVASAVDLLLQDVKETLLLPFSTLSSLLSATVRELARSQGKDVELVIEGADVEVDRRLLDALTEPLVHLLRNAVDHGMELPANREATGKTARGTITVCVERPQGGTIVLRVEDDGAGVDLQKLADLARRAGIPLDEDAAPHDILQLVFAPGLSTAPSLSQVSGRGEGLAIVQDKVERLGGTIALDSAAGQGTCFTLTLPVSLATLRVVQVAAGGMCFFLPVSHVERCGRLPATAPSTLGGRETLALGGDTLPLVSLAAVLELPAAGDTAGYLVLRAGPRRLAFAVEEVCAEQEVLAKPLDAGLSRAHAVLGAATGANGATVVILNPASLVRLALQAGPSRFARPPQPSRRRLSILLAEDSITSRMLLKNILELAGHEVTVAVDGAQALALLGGGTFDLLVSDIEMPNLDGFALTEAVRKDPRLSQLPVILVTSLSSPGDRERGARAGANAYLDKSAFEQRDLLQAIRELA